jgi:hypothetical protein
VEHRYWRVDAATNDRRSEPTDQEYSLIVSEENPHYEVDPSVKTAPHQEQDIKILLLKIQITRRG